MSFLSCKIFQVVQLLLENISGFLKKPYEKLRQERDDANKASDLPRLLLMSEWNVKL